MAKRELIDTKKLIRKMNQSNAFDISERIRFSNLIDGQRPVTEQEIVKPYLDKLKAEIEKEAFTDVNNSKFISVNRVNQIFDKCKAESEDK